MGARNNKALREPKNKGAKAAALNKKFKKKPCSFCRDKVTYIDYKDIATLRKYISDRGKIRARRVTGACTCSKHIVCSSKDIYPSTVNNLTYPAVIHSSTR